MSISIPQSGQPAPRPAEQAVPAGSLAHSASIHASLGQIAGAPSAPKVKAQDPSQMREELSQAIELLNEMVRKQGRDLSFSMDDKLNRPIIQVKNTRTGELVRQIPDETVLKVAHSIEDLKGLLLNERS